ncbi:MAG: hypothetical protein AAFV98_11005 [Chloroflexota bacterium]
MRRVWILVLCLCLPLLNTSAQESVDEFFCPEIRESYEPQFIVAAPALDENLLDLTVTALGVGNYDPLLGVQTATDAIYCNDNAPISEAYALSLPSGDIPPAVTGANIVLFEFGANTVYVAEQDGGTGATLLLFEGVIDAEDHTYTLEITEAMVAAGGEAFAYVLPIAGEYTPELTVPDSEGTLIQADTVDATLQSPFAFTETAVGAPIPLEVGTVDITVNANEIGMYTLILELQSGEIQFGDGVASIETTEAGAITLSCDNTPIFENGLQVAFPDDLLYTATILGTAADTVGAVMREDGTGICYDDVSAADFYSVDLPSIQTTRNFVHSQAIVTPDDDNLVFGGKESIAGNYVLIVEGGVVDEDDILGGDTFEVTVTPQMASSVTSLTVYVMTTEAAFDPLLTWQIDEENAIVCSAAGSEGLCDQPLPDFASSRINIGPSLTLQSINYNPYLQIQISDEMVGSTLPFTVSGTNDTQGAYVLIMHFVTE